MKSIFSFCESIHATVWGKWHIRRLTKAGKKLGGGIDSPSLCGKLNPETTNGWDLEVPIRDFHLNQNTCKDCAEAYRKATK